MSPLRVIENPQQFTTKEINLNPNSVIEDDKFLSINYWAKILGLTPPSVYPIARQGNVIESGEGIRGVHGVRGFRVRGLPNFIEAAQRVNTDFSKNPHLRYHSWAEKLDGETINPKETFRFRTKHHILYEYTPPKR